MPKENPAGAKALLYFEDDAARLNSLVKKA
jgi:hypothetical protein